MKKFASILILLLLPLLMFAQSDKSFKGTEFVFGSYYSLLGSGDYKAFMNEFGVRRYFNHSGVDLNVNFVQSFQNEEYEYYNFNHNRSHSVNMTYFRLNYFIIPIVFKQISFDFGVGGLFGHTAYTYVFIQDISAFESKYEEGWTVGYNLRLNIKTYVAGKCGLSLTAGFDVLGTDTNAFMGLTLSRKLL